MDFNRRNFLKSISLTAFAGAASPRLAAEGTTLALPEMANGRLKPGKLQEDNQPLWLIRHNSVMLCKLQKFFPLIS